MSAWRRLGLAGASAAVGLLACVGFGARAYGAARNAREPGTAKGRTARDIFYSAGLGSLTGGADQVNPGVPQQLALSYRILLHTRHGQTAVTEDTVFRSGDQVRLSFTSNVPGYLYIFNRGTSTTGRMLFPDARINGGDNRVTPFTEYVVPAAGWFEFDQQPGDEKLYIFLSPTPLDQLQGAAKTASGAVLDANGWATVTALFDRAVVNRPKDFRTSRDIFYVDPGQPVATPAAVSTTTTYVAGPQVNATGALLLHDITLRHEARQPPRLRSARDIFYNAGPGAEPTPVGNLPSHIALSYKILQATPQGYFTETTEDQPFRSGDKFRLLFSSNMDGCLYVFLKGSSSKCSRIFPDARINGGRNDITGYTDYIVPPAGYFEFDRQPGQEKLYIFLSSRKLDDLEGLKAEQLPSGAVLGEDGFATVTALVQRGMAGLPRIDRKSRDMFFVAPGQQCSTGGTSTISTYVALPVKSETATLLHDITLEHR